MGQVAVSERFNRGRSSQISTLKGKRTGIHGFLGWFPIGGLLFD